MSFAEVYKHLSQKQKKVTYRSLTSSNTYSVCCTLPKHIKKQAVGNKIVVWDVDKNKSLDIEIDTIEKVEECIQNEKT